MTYGNPGDYDMTATPGRSSLIHIVCQIDFTAGTLELGAAGDAKASNPVPMT